MRVDSCRKCGMKLKIINECKMCNKPNQFFCHNCKTSTEEQIHYECKMIETIV